MTMGAMARIGIVCEAMIQGSRLFCSDRAWTIRTASMIPTTVPIAKPSSVAARVTQPW